jgi:Bacteriocin-protection, YdeI or OmpD-Associated/Domain of unknown function (DUF1905)
MKFRTTLQLHGKTATGIEVPEKVVEALGGGGGLRVRATIGGHAYPTTVARMRGAYLFPVSAHVCEKAGLAAGDRVEVSLELDTGPRELTIPDDLAAALKRDRAAKKAFDGLSYTNRKRHVLAVEEAKTEETRRRRVAKVLEALAE